LDLNVGAHDLTKTIHGIGDSQRVEVVTFEISDQTTAHAPVVVVGGQVGVEAHAALPWTEGIEKP
jgi:hypothetical protein